MSYNIANTHNSKDTSTTSALTCFPQGHQCPSPYTPSQPQVNCVDQFSSYANGVVSVCVCVCVYVLDFESHPSNAHGLLLVLHLRIPPGSAWVTIWDSGV